MVLHVNIMVEHDLLREIIKEEIDKPKGDKTDF